MMLHFNWHVRTFVRSQSAVRIPQSGYLRTSVTFRSLLVSGTLNFMASPVPSDSANTKKADAEKHEGNHTNLLDIWSDVKKNALAPIYNSVAVDSINALGNVVNTAADAGTWAINKVTKDHREAWQVGKVHEMEVAKVESNSLAGLTQQVCGTAGSFLAYGIAGKVAGRVMRVGGELMPAELAIKDMQIGMATRSLAQDQRVATIIGATAYAGLKDPKEGEDRKSNMVGTLVGFSFYEAGNAYFVNPRSAGLARLGQRFEAGFVGGIAQSDATSLAKTGKLADIDANFSSAVSGGVLNAIMPGGRRMIDAATEGPLFKNVPHITEATGRLYSDAVRNTPSNESVVRGSWADPKAVQAVNRMAIYDLKTRLNVTPPTEAPPSSALKFSLAADSAHPLGKSIGKPLQSKPEQIWIDQKANVIHTPADSAPRDVIHEIAHRRIFKDPVYEAQFKSQASQLVSFDPLNPLNAHVKEQYVNTRLDQEIAARTIENREALSMGDRRQVSIDRTQILQHEGYAERFEREADAFVSSGGKTRPEVDHSSSSSLRSSYGPAAIEAVNPVTLDGASKLAGSDTAGSTGTSRDGISLVGGTDVQAAERLAHVTKWDRMSTEIIRSSKDPKDKPQNNLYTVVRNRLNATGLAREGWKVLPTQTGSPLDQVGCDYALVNAQKNQVIFLDATQNTEKLNDPGAHNVSAMRVSGLIGFESRWMDMLGHLRTDEPGAIGDAATDFQHGLDGQLKMLTEHGSSITVEMLPSPMRQATPQETGLQVDNFKKALAARAAQYPHGSFEQQELANFARGIDRGASKYNQFVAATKPSPELSDAMQRQADRVVLDYALTKMSIKPRVEPPKVTPANNNSSNVKMTKDGHMVISVDDTIYDGGDVKEALTEARRSLRSNSQKLTEMLQKDKTVQNKMKADGLTFPQMLRMVQEELVSAREVDNGLLGTRNIGLDEALRGRIANQRLDNVVSGRAPATPERSADSGVESADKPGPKRPGDIRPPAFTPAQQVEIPAMAATLSQFGLSLKDGVSPDELKTFIQMYSESAETPEGRQLAADYLAETQKPIAQQRLIPKLHGALIESQMRLENQSSNRDNGTNASVLDGSVSAGDASRSRANISNENVARGTEQPELPFEQVRMTLQRLQELQASKNLTPDEQFQLEALQAFKAHIMDASARDAVAAETRAITAGNSHLGVSAIALAAVLAWYKQRQSDKTADVAKLS